MADNPKKGGYQRPIRADMFEKIRGMTMAAPINPMMHTTVIAVGLCCLLVLDFLE